MIPIIVPQLGEAEAKAAQDSILSGWVTQGPRTRQFEEAFATYTGARYSCAVSNCTAALHLALLVVGVKPGDEVITVSHSFIATANAIRYCGAIPVFVDIEPDTFNIDQSKIEAALSPLTSAILCVHQIGMPCDIETILGIARRRGLPLVEDAACAIGSEIKMNGKWEKIGKPHGDIACFSFHPRKIITTGDGGMLTTNNKDYDNALKLLRQHAMSVVDTVRHSSQQIIFESYPTLGFNYRMTDIQAAVGIEQLKRLPDILEKRRQLAARYHKLLAEIRGLSLQRSPEWARSNWQSFCVRLPPKCDQVGIMQRMLDLGVSTRRGIMCAHREPAYATQPWRCGGDLSCKTSGCACLTVSECAQDECILLPLYGQMSETDQDTVVAALIAAFAEVRNDSQ